MRLVSVDCGVRGCGVAVFESNGLLKATYVKNPVKRGHGGPSVLALAREVYSYVGVTDILAIETMSFYSADQQKGAQSDIGAVQLVAGAVIGMLGPRECVSYLPSEWKGTISADHCTERIYGRLNDTERARVAHVSESVDHNTIDACGIGLRYLGRFEPLRVFARD